MKAGHTTPSPRYPEPQPVSGLRTAIEEAKRERPINFLDLLERASRVVAGQFEITVEELLGPSRTRCIAEARVALYLLLRENSRASLTYIGTPLGKDHGTILSGCRRAADLIATDADYAARVARCRASLMAASSAPNSSLP